jgi:hypothetical protein
MTEKPTQPKTIPTSVAHPTSEKPMSFADILKKGSKGPEPIFSPRNIGIPSKTIPQKEKPATHKDRRLILNEATKQDEIIDSLKLRNQINKAFQDQKITAIPVIASVTKSFLGTNIVLTTTEQYSAEFLNQNKTIWESYFKFRNTTKDTPWHKVVIHGIPMDIFGQEEGLDFLEEEIKIFNGLKPIIKPNWLSSAENRKIKKHASVIVSFEIKAEADKALRNRLYIAGISMRTVECISKERKKPEKFSHVQI